MRRRGASRALAIEFTGAPATRALIATERKRYAHLFFSNAGSIASAFRSTSEKPKSTA